MIHASSHLLSVLEVSGVILYSVYPGKLVYIFVSVFNYLLSALEVFGEILYSVYPGNLFYIFVSVLSLLILQEVSRVTQVTFSLYLIVSVFNPLLSELEVSGGILYSVYPGKLVYIFVSASSDLISALEVFGEILQCLPR